MKREGQTHEDIGIAAKNCQNYKQPEWAPFQIYRSQKLSIENSWIAMEQDKKAALKRELCP